jgi:hypothetical protein
MTSSSNPIGSLPPLPPDLMSSILGDSSAVQALGGTPSPASSSPFAPIEPTPAPAAPSYDPTQDPANPAYQDPSASPPDWTQDLANPEFWA